MNERNGFHYHEELPEEQDNLFEEESLLTDELDHEILMHRDAHFGGSFEVMLDYYSQERVGVNPDFDLDRIEYLEAIEKQTDQNLAAVLLDISEIERVANARKAYREFKNIYEIDAPKSPFPRLIADLILTEEEEPEAEIAAVVGKGKNIVPELLAIIKSEDAYDPLFPGYGYAPYLAMLCLGQIKDENSVIPLFETLRKDTVFGPEAALETLAEIGPAAKEFLLKLVQSRPLTQDNYYAAYALSFFHPDPEIAQVCASELKKPEVKAHAELSAYLECQAENLTE